MQPNDKPAIRSGSSSPVKKKNRENQNDIKFKMKGPCKGIGNMERVCRTVGLCFFVYWVVGSVWWTVIIFLPATKTFQEKSTETRDVHLKPFTETEGNEKGGKVLIPSGSVLFVQFKRAKGQ